jgi:predicted RNA binding protein YcfA (HicA-like mRNA interferase family)
VPKLPALSGKEVISILTKIGFEVRRQRGSHIILVKVINGKKVG